MNRIIQTILIVSAALMLPLTSSAIEKGVVKVFSVKGDVTLVDVNTGASIPLERGMEFTDNTQVVTGPQSTALLLFSNGAVVTVTQESQFTVREFVQAQFNPAQGTFMRLTEDPSISKTDLFLNDGKVSGQVKRLQQGSTYTVNTPTASAGIRGTVYVVTYNANTGTTTIVNADGSVVYTTTGQATVGGQPVQPGRAVVIKANQIDNPDGTTSFVIDPDAPVQDVPLSNTAAVVDAINAIDENASEQDVQDAVEALQDAVEATDAEAEQAALDSGFGDVFDDDGTTPALIIDPSVPNEVESPAGD